MKNEVDMLLAKRIVDAVKDEVLENHLGERAGRWPLVALVYENDKDFWWFDDRKKIYEQTKTLRRRHGAAIAQLEIEGKTKAVLSITKKGNNPKLFVTSDVEVVIIDTL